MDSFVVRPEGRSLVRRCRGTVLCLVAFLPSAPFAAETLSLAKARALTLERNPDLAAAADAIVAADALLLQAEVLPNPRIDATFEDVAGSNDYTGARRAQSTLAVAQRLELGGKRTARRELAVRGLDGAHVSLAARRVRALAEVDERFGHLLGDQAELGLRKRARALAEEGLAVVESQFRAGRLSDIERHKARAEVSRSRIAEEHAEHELRSARRRLSALWDEAEPSFAAAEGELDERRPLPTFAEIERRLGEAPELREAEVEIAVRSATLAVARAEAVPDVEVSAGVRRYEADDDVTLVMGVSMPLPLFDRRRGAAAAAGAELRRAESGKRAAAARLRSSVYGLFQELRHADTELTVLEKEIAVDSTRALERSREAFEVGRLPFLELLDAQRTFVAVEKSRIDTAVDLWRLRARIERVIGGTLP